jgi:hypothetical protein
VRLTISGVGGAGGAAEPFDWIATVRFAPLAMTIRIESRGFTSVSSRSRKKFTATLREIPVRSSAK